MKSSTRSLFEQMPLDSQVRNRCIKQGTGIPLFRTETQQGCKYIDNIFKELNSPPKKGLFSFAPGGFMNGVRIGTNTHKLEENISAVLPEASHEVKNRNIIKS